MKNVRHGQHVVEVIQVYVHHFVPEIPNIAVMEHVYSVMPGM